MQEIDSSASELIEHLQNGSVSSVELTKAALDQIATHDKEILAFLSVDAQASLERSAEIDQRRATGKPVGKLAGLPISVKDVLCTKGRVTTCGSKMLENFRPPFDATAIQRLQSADAVIVGKVNMDEFAMGGSNENSAYQVTRNPWNTNCIPGGSSGGSAASVAAGMVPLSIGSDTGGSVRQPAALCGVTGLKPTYGRISRWGLVAFASSLDQIGPVGRSAEDVAWALEVMAGHDTADSTCVDREVPAYTQTIAQPLQGLKLGIVDEHFAPGLDNDVRSAVEQGIEVYKSLGAQVKKISLPHSKYAIAVYYVIACCEASSNLAGYDGVHYGHRTDEAEMLAELEQQRKEFLANGDKLAAESMDNALVRMYRRSRAEGFGSEVKRRIMLGTYALSAGYYDAYYLKALKVRQLIRQDYDKAFEQVDLIVGPTTPTPAFKIGEKVDDPLSMYLGDLYTVSANLAGIGAISIPCGFSEQQLPIGLQLQAPPFEEERLLRGAHMFQQETDWHLRRADLS